MSRPGLKERSELPGGDIIAPTKAAVHGHQGPSGELSPHKDDGVEVWLDGAVLKPCGLEGEALQAFSSFPGEQLSGGRGLAAPHQQETQAGDCRGVVPPAVQGGPPGLPAGWGELVTAVTVTGDKGVLPGVQGMVVHLHGDWKRAVHLPGGWSPQLSRGDGTGVKSIESSKYSKS